MKKVIRINGKKMGTIDTPNIMHFEIQKNSRVQVYKNKKAYCRKSKYVSNEY